ncbi:Sas10 C-terminal domain-containing protein [Fimicolochytrium jonesii]|uniref:Sas10 C-terminal domain-containing protein n=1 Tax=Fimicolochytrium jonesii TaxID=1396493 RepID=UPI0022FDFB9E|nr:Sas10 C-terminal domain-containing protein [Fimicolochytrium jonesii]KAI8823009.1 Sas10 C-terminal domain-containing protein [Fimicolochytrium jonesii]
MARKKGGRNKLNRPNTASRDEMEDYKVGASADLENVGLDSEDEFHQQRESISIDDAKLYQRRRRGQDEDEEADEDVFGLGLEDSDDEDDEDDEDEALLKKLQMGLKGGAGLDSDDDVYGQEEDEAEAAGKTSKKKGANADEMDERAWGKSRKMYYDANDATDEEDAKAEEEEALRLQRLRVSQIREEDFLDDFGDSFAKRVAGETTTEATPVTMDEDDLDHLGLSSSFPLNLLPSALTEVEVVSKDTSSLPQEELVKIAEASIPDIVGLLAEFRERWEECREVVGPTLKWSCKPEDGSIKSGIARAREYLELKYRLLVTYSTNVAFYLSLRANPPAGVNVQSHPVVQSLVQLRELLANLEARVEGKVDSDDDESSEADSDEDAAAQRKRRKRRRKEKRRLRRGMPDLQADIEALISGEVEVEELEVEEQEDADEGLEEESEEFEAPKTKLAKKTKAAREVNGKKSAKQYEIPEESYVPIGKDKKKKSVQAKAARQIANDFGESNEIDELDIDDKIARKRSLKFHVTKVDQAITARQKRLARNAGGDDDIPYRDKFGKLIIPGAEQPETKAVQPSRLFGKPDDLENNSDNEGADMGGLDNGFGEMPDFDKEAPAKGRKRTRGDDAEEDDAPEVDEDALAYYENIASAKKQKKSEKDDRIRVEKEVAAEMSRFDDPDAMEETRKRPATYKILSNKGLTPYRPKEARNPRVKKRMRFEQAQKKLKSFKRVVQKESKAGYAGETTGIKKDLARSVRFAK